MKSISAVLLAVVGAVGLSGCAYAGVAATADKAVVARNDGFLFGALRTVYVCKVTDAGLTNCKDAESPLAPAATDLDSPLPGRAYTLVTLSTMPVSTVAALVERGTPLRKKLRLAVECVLEFGDNIDGRAVLGLLTGAGYDDLAADLGATATFLRANWEVAQKNSGVTLEMIAEARDLSDQLAVALGQREMIPVSSNDAKRIRNRCFTLLWNRYEEVRRAMQYLRHHQGDATALAPALNNLSGVGRPPKKKEGKGSDAETETTQPTV